jgi:hypothetical protein
MWRLKRFLFRPHLDQVVRMAVEETLNALQVPKLPSFPLETGDHQTLRRSETSV